jgi:hypothetical protein
MRIPVPKGGFQSAFALKKADFCPYLFQKRGRESAFILHWDNPKLFRTFATANSSWHKQVEVNIKKR